MPRLVHPLSPLVVALALGVTAPLVLAPTGSARAGEHVVRRGETLGGIARKYQCKLVDLKRANALRGDVIRAGKTLVIPDDCGADAAGAAPDAAGRSTPATPAAPARRPRTVTHEVLPDETLDAIASRYQTTPEAITAANKGVLKKGLRPGLKLKIKTTADERAQKRTVYKIQPGDTLGRIARRFGVTVKDLQRMNPGKDPDKLQIGHKLVIYGEGRPSRSEAVGRPQGGKLVNGEQLKDGPGYFVRRPDAAWGTNEMIRALREAFAELKKRHPSGHDICVGDLSRKEGGYLPPHKSHQTGLDADLGFVFKGQSRQGPKVFLNASAGLDLEGTWKLIVALAGPSEAASKVEYMFIDYGVQKRLYDWAKDNGVSDAKLDWLLQYPRGSRAMRGLVRHEPSHQNHIHIRYNCPNGDDKCM